MAKAPEKKTADRPANITERQAKYFATLKAGLERDTGKTLEEWAKIARKCPETKPRARAKWLKDHYGHTVNRASVILSAAFPETSKGWSDGEALVNDLWTDEKMRAVYERVDAAALSLNGALRTARKGYTAWAREFQFAAARPTREGVRFGLALDPASDPRLSTAKPKEGWSERLKAVMILSKPGDFDAGAKKLLKQAFERS